MIIIFQPASHLFAILTLWYHDFCFFFDSCSIISTPLVDWAFPLLLTLVLVLIADKLTYCSQDCYSTSKGILRQPLFYLVLLSPHITVCSCAFLWLSYFGFTLSLLARFLFSIGPTKTRCWCNECQMIERLLIVVVWR